MICFLPQKATGENSKYSENLKKFHLLDAYFL